ncbi:MAG: 3'-5' exoribonuclease [Bacteroidaceae bacterium]|nr:3'-5' exoribonuclease [Bacteroidaceae bacterium]
MRDFIAIDFETANGQPSSVCSVGAVMVRNGRVADSFYSLIQPEPNYYSYFCQRVHGLSQRDTDKAPVFPVVWHQLEDCIADVFFSDQLAFFDRRELIPTLPFVAHNARFDEGCLQAARQHFGRVLPNHQLHTVAAACGYDLQRHHHALADAEACAAIALKLLASSSNKISRR